MSKRFWLVSNSGLENCKTPPLIVTTSNKANQKFSNSNNYSHTTCTAQKIKFSIRDFFSKYDQIRSFQQIWSHLLEKPLIKNFILCAVLGRFSRNLCSANIKQTTAVLFVPSMIPFKRFPNGCSENVLQFPGIHLWRISSLATKGTYLVILPFWEISTGVFLRINIFFWGLLFFKL